MQPINDLPSLRDPSKTDRANEANIIEPGPELHTLLTKGVDVVNAMRQSGEAPIDPSRPIVLALYPFRAELDTLGPPSDVYNADPKQRTRRQNFIDQLWVLPLDGLTKGQLGVPGSLAMRKYGGNDVYGVMVLQHARGYVAPAWVEQYATGKVIDGRPWLHVGQVQIHASRDGLVRARRLITFQDFETLEFDGTGSLAREPSEVVDVGMYFAANANRGVGAIGVRVCIYDSFRDLYAGYNPLDPKQREIYVVPLERVLFGDDGRAHAAMTVASMHSAAVARILVQTLGFVHQGHSLG